jgi:hypothetical protein
MGRTDVFASLALLILATACVPYTVGTTAQPVPQGDWVSSGVSYVIPGGLERARTDGDSGATLSAFGLDAEARYGLDERSDVGVRVPGLAGIVIDYKRRLGGERNENDPATAILVGGGVVNLGAHALVQLGFVTSGRQSEQFTPYGGVKIMQVIPLTKDAVHDRPTAGLFIGVRIGKVDLGISPELGIYYDHSALGLRRRDLIFVPAITVHGSSLLHMFSR